MQHGTALRNRKMKSGSDLTEVEVFESYHLPQVPVMPITGSGHGHKVTFSSLVLRPRSVLSTPHLAPQLVSFSLSGNSNIEMSGKDTDSVAEGRPKTPHHKTRRMRQDASIASHSLQLMTEEFIKICKPKIKKLKGQYSASTMLVFNSWLKYVEMCMKE